MMTLDVIEWFNRGKNQGITEFIKGFKRGAKSATRAIR